MSQSGTAPAYDYELLFLFARNQKTTGPAVVMFALTIAALCLFWTHWIWPIAWLSTVLFAQGWTQRLARRLLDEETDTVNIKGWVHLFTALEFFNATLWSSLSLVTGHRDHFAFDVFVFATLLIVVCVRAIQASPIFQAVYAATLPLTLTLAITFLGSHEVEPIAMAGIAVCAQVFFVMIARRTNETTLTMLHYRAEKDSLIAELEEEKSKSDEARRRAEDANVAKSRFLATMSHELRTPLNAILGFSELMKDEAFGVHSNPKYKEYADDIHRSGRHLLELINEILDLSRIEAGRYEMSEEAVALVHTLEDCCYLMALRAEAKNIELVEAFSSEMPRLWADSRAVRQICLNLLSNAIKFTPMGGCVTVQCGMARDGRPFFSVADTGPGIPEDELDTIMTSFGQGSLAQETAEDGAGLGLPIVRGLVNLHGGELVMRSKVRVGTNVTIFFPMSRIMPDFDMMAPTSPQQEAADAA